MVGYGGFSVVSVCRFCLQVVIDSYALRWCVWWWCGLGLCVVLFPLVCVWPVESMCVLSVCVWSVVLRLRVCMCGMFGVGFVLVCAVGCCGW